MLALIAIIALPPQTALDVSPPSLIASVRRYQSGKPFLVGIRFQMQPRWHVYWRNPGDAGQEPRVKWTLPKGWKASNIYWPYPEQHTDDGGLTSYIYSKEVVLPVEITPSESSKPVQIIAQVDWLACDKACIPGTRKLSLNLVAGTVKPDQVSEAKIRNALAMTPGSKISGQGTKTGKEITLRVAKQPAPGSVFLPYDSGVLDHSAKQVIEPDGTIRLTASAYFNAKVTSRLRGIILQPNNAAHRPVEIDAPLQITGERK